MHRLKTSCTSHPGMLDACLEEMVYLVHKLQLVDKYIGLYIDNTTNSPSSDANNSFRNSQSSDANNSACVTQDGANVLLF